MKRELRLGLGVVLMTFACDDGRKVGDEVGIGGRLGTGGESSATAGRAAAGAATSLGGVMTLLGGSSALGGIGAAGVAGASGPTKVPYCRMSGFPTMPRTPCPVDYCASLNSALALSDGETFIFAGAEVRAGRCAAPEDAFDAVYFGTGLFLDTCYYRGGALVGIAQWGDTTVQLSDGCTIFRGPVVYGEFPDSALTESLKGCPGLTTYREMRSFAAGAAGAPNGPPVGDCYQATDATCGPC